MTTTQDGWCSECKLTGPCQHLNPGFPPRPPPTSRPTFGERGRDEQPTRRSGPRSGWRSTKLHLALIGIAVVTAVFLYVVARTGSVAGFGEYCLAVVTLVASSHGARVAESFAQRPVRTPSPEKEG